jgi:maltose/moltooligosaccharide transporter
MKLSYWKTILVGLAFMTICAFWQLYDFKIPLILKNTFGVGDTIAGVIMALDNVVALFLLPLLGAVSDRTSTRIGRRKPYILLGTAASVAIMMLIPYATHTRQLAVFVVALGFLLISMATYRSPAVALMPDVTPKPLRSKGNAVINLMGAIGGALILLVNSFFAKYTEGPEPNYWPIFLVTAGIMVVGTLILNFTINEPKLVKKMREDSAAMGIDPEEATEDIKKVQAVSEPLPADKRKSMLLILASIFLWFMGYNAVTTAFSKYSVSYLLVPESTASILNMIAVVAATVSFIPVGIISTRIGRKKSILFGVVLLAVVFGTATLYTGYSPLMYVTLALAGVAWASINVNSLPMVLEMSKGANVGKYTGYYYSASMAAQAVTPFLSGFLLEFVDYKTLFPYGAVFVGLAFFTMLAVKHGDSKPVKQSNLEALGAGD